MPSGLYLITDDNSDGSLFKRVESALKGGVRTVQYRAKEATADERFGMAQKLRKACHAAGAKLIINDFPELAKEIDADGVHLGQDDMSVSQARQMLGRDKIIGVSTHSVDQALKAESHGADYIALGSIFPTSSKDAPELVGIDALRKVRRAIRVPLVAIGGIDITGADLAIDAGADAVAVISSVMQDRSPGIAAREISLLFNRKLGRPRGRVLTIAGSDCGGGAGIQADLKTISLLGSYGSCVITALTAQNTLGVKGVFPIDSNFVTEQLNAVLDDIGTDTIKTGMLSWGGTVTRVAQAIRRHCLLAVVDPVMIAKGGAPLLDKEALDSLLSQMLPQAYLLTPNLPEAEKITGTKVRNLAEMEEAGRLLQDLGARNVLMKGGHLINDDAVDLLLIGDAKHELRSPRIETKNTHGTGCTYSSAIATFLAQGLPLLKAVEEAKKFIDLSIITAVESGKGHGSVNHVEAAFRYFHEHRS
ncbi:bifunctional hydroxymethylpyrimidine kinase/phosphomethylpyrimidine kinase [Geopsychrobacter electrodiphilus]|uniref:bifunctional hydroxymethylpyrimidine kinase/phosphomethylpyrimidine kinase n=1 Tax=Geopsychrobacter electrodiphilus TaxID=225196 RepID=UPI000360AE9F|nr:bifunctional hydroxymethylpyrimidine kinase/phosphomethylpyrimidine kinase [Geopsychrobacter electrodiphilus]